MLLESTPERLSFPVPPVDRPGAPRAMKPTDIVDQASLRTDIPDFAPR